MDPMQSRVVLAICVDNLGSVAMQLLENRIRPRRSLDRGSSELDRRLQRMAAAARGEVLPLSTPKRGDLPQGRNAP
jgi:hypothetical protein